MAESSAATPPLKRKAHSSVAPCRASGIEELLTATQLGGDQKQVLDSVKEYYGEVRGNGGAAGPVGDPVDSAGTQVRRSHCLAPNKPAPSALSLLPGADGDRGPAYLGLLHRLLAAASDPRHPKRVPEEVKAKYYGCGSPFPMGIDGLRCGVRAEASSCPPFRRQQGRSL